MNLKNTVNRYLIDALGKLNLAVESFDLSSPKNPKFGDLSTNVALILAKKVGGNPLEIARKIEQVILIEKSVISEITITPPGFINFKISPSYYQTIVQQIIDKDEHFNTGDIGKGKTANVEFVSANPTGPLSVGHGRQAVLGDTIANILQWHGYDVTREYYYNDGGKQMRILANSVEARYFQIIGKEVEWSSDFYQGEYIENIAKDIKKEFGEKVKSGDKYFRKVAEERIFSDIRKTLENIGISHDVFSNEKYFIESNKIETIIKDLRKEGLAYEEDGATWFKTTALGKDQDRVLIKSSGEPAYRLPDILYHRDKFERNYDLLIDVFGADHIDSYPDVILALEALGYDTSNLRVLIHQFVTLTKGREKVKMSTRKAEYVTLNELIRLVGKDVVRYFFLMRGMNTHLNFDIELAQDQSENNPVFYLQYAHARICNIIRHGKQQGVTFNKDYDPSLLSHDAEITLIKQLNQFSDIMATVLESLEPRSIANYLQSLATSFHKFYTECHVITNDIPLSRARIALITATRKILAQGLNILGISAPERM
ncbi:MAG: arginine--tRNA ligase [Planctomycetia bacterium]|nr:arginine--tRNA ligase [Planctomycetia bacterium]